MIVQEFLKQADIEKQVELIMSNQPSYEKPYDETKVRENMTEFINMLLTLKPKVSDDYIMIYEKYYDTDIDDVVQEYSVMELYKKQELQKGLDKIQGMENPVTSYNENMSKEELKSLAVDKYDFIPHGYGYEFNEWEETLGYEVYTGNLTADIVQDALYNILFEMSFNGMTRESQEERQNELDEAIKETEEIRKLPEEEQKKHFKTVDDLFDDGDTTITRKELDDSERLMWYCSLKTASYLFDLLKEIVL